MRAALRTVALCLGLLMASIGVHAEGGFCPPGTIDHNNGRAPAIVCSPIPGYGQQQAPQQPAPQWESRWGAIATSTVDGILGASTDKRSEREASRVAMQDCQSKGGAKCKVDASYDNQCAAVGRQRQQHDLCDSREAGHCAFQDSRCADRGFDEHAGCSKLTGVHSRAAGAAARSSAKQPAGHAASGACDDSLSVSFISQVALQCL